MTGIKKCFQILWFFFLNGVVFPALNTEDIATLDLMHSRSKDTFLLGNSDAGRLYKYIVKTNDAKSQFELGLLYEKGKGVPQNDHEAVRWWSKSAKNGYMDAQYSLAVMYHTGRGVTTTSAQSDIEAYKNMLAAAEQGHIKAQYNVGKMYEFGRGIEQSYSQSARWYKDAAEHGMSPAAYSLGILYRKGLGVPQSDEKAQKWYDTAAGNGMSFAQLRAYNKHKEDRYNNDLVHRASKMNRKYKSPTGPKQGGGRKAPNWDAVKQFKHHSGSEQQSGDGGGGNELGLSRASTAQARLHRQQELLKRESET